MDNVVGEAVVMVAVAFVTRATEGGLSAVVEVTL